MRSASVSTGGAPDFPSECGSPQPFPGHCVWCSALCPPRFPFSGKSETVHLKAELLPADTDQLLPPSLPASFLPAQRVPHAPQTPLRPAQGPRVNENFSRCRGADLSALVREASLCALRQEMARQKSGHERGAVVPGISRSQPLTTLDV